MLIIPDIAERKTNPKGKWRDVKHADGDYDLMDEDEKRDTNVFHRAVS